MLVSRFSQLLIDSNRYRRSRLALCWQRRFRPGIKRAHEIDDHQDDPYKLGSREIREGYNLCLLKIGRVAEQRAKLRDDSNVEGAREVEGVNNRDGIGQVKIAFVHFW